MKINVPLGIENFAELIENGCYYVDKTGFIKELLGETFKVNLITRPRRFGKTLAMSMLEEFFDIQKDSREIFAGLEISQDTRLCAVWQNQWPVLFLTLKDIEGNTFRDAYGLLKYVIANLCKKHSYLAKSSMADEDDRNIFLALKSCAGDEAQVKGALQTMMRMMAAHYGKPVILLVDEYDVPLAKASDYGYYEEMLQVVRSLLGMAWKTNPFLKFAVVTGCLRIAKESIFTGANNFVSRSISGKRYSRYFGFLEQEVKQLLEAAGFSPCFSKMKKWYNGYLFGGQEVFCPWDVLNYVSELTADPDAEPGNYWKSTSHNKIIRRFIEMERIAAKDKFETLLAGGAIEVSVVEDMTYDFDYSTEDNLWSILYLAGYLTQLPAGKQAMLKDCRRALEQIEKNSYTAKLLKGYQTVLCYGAAFFEKKCLIKLLSKQENIS